MQEVCHVVAADGEELSPASVAALLLKLPLVAPDWVAAVAAKKVHAQSLPDPERFCTEVLLLPPVPGQQQHQDALNVECWEQPSEVLLRDYQLLFSSGHGQVITHCTCADVCVGMQANQLPECSINAMFGTSVQAAVALMYLLPPLGWVAAPM
jgi:hypothetical protein